MFKNIIFIFLYYLVCPNLFSQDYDPILKEGSFWDIETEFWGSYTTKQYQRIQVDGEIQINTKTYTKLKQVNIQVSEISGESHYSIDNSKFIAINNAYLRENV